MLPASAEPMIAADFGNGVKAPDRPAPSTVARDLYWRSLSYFNLYRLASVAVFFAASLLGHRRVFGGRDPALFDSASAVYFLLCVVALIAIRLRRPSISKTLGSLVTCDVLFIAVATFASGGVRSGLGMMLLITLAAAGLIGRGRVVLFYASLASVAMLVEEGYQVLYAVPDGGEFLHAGILSVSYFAVALLAWTLAQYATESERIAAQRGVDLANLGEVNQLIIDDMDGGVLVIDQKGAIVHSNRAAISMLGPMPLSGEAPPLAGYCGDLEQMRRDWLSDPSVKFKIMRSPTSGAELRVRSARLGAHAPGAMLAFVEDISQERAQARQIKLAALGRLTANIAHEIRNPLAAITHAAELLEEEVQQRQTDTMLLRIIRDNSNRLDRMVREVLQLNRRDRAQPEAVVPSAFLASYVEEFCHAEKADPQVISIEVDSVRPFSFDRNHLHQVLWNLTRNAWRYCRKQPSSVRVCVSRNLIPNLVQIDVIDDGPGVAPDLQSQLFEPFFTTDSQGTGLGLYIARELCEANGATLESSRSPRADNSAC